MYTSEIHFQIGSLQHTEKHQIVSEHWWDEMASITNKAFKQVHSFTITKSPILRQTYPDSIQIHPRRFSECDWTPAYFELRLFHYFILIKISCFMQRTLKDATWNEWQNMIQRQNSHAMQNIVCWVESYERLLIIICQSNSFTTIWSVFQILPFAVAWQPLFEIDLFHVLAKSHTWLWLRYHTLCNLTYVKERKRGKQSMYALQLMHQSVSGKSCCIVAPYWNWGVNHANVPCQLLQPHWMCRCIAGGTSLIVEGLCRLSILAQSVCAM